MNFDIGSSFSKGPGSTFSEGQGPGLAPFYTECQSKQVLPIRYTLEKKFFAACECFLLGLSKNTGSILWYVWAFHAFLEKKKAIRSYAMCVNLIFYM